MLSNRQERWIEEFVENHPAMVITIKTYPGYINSSDEICVYLRSWDKSQIHIGVYSSAGADLAQGIIDINNKLSQVLLGITTISAGVSLIDEDNS